MPRPAANAAELSHGVFSNALGGLEDSLVKFARPESCPSPTLADSIIADLARSGSPNRWSVG